MRSHREHERTSSMKARAAREHRRVEIERLIASRGLRVEPFGESGAVRVLGTGVDLLVRDWAAVGPADLRPAP